MYGPTNPPRFPNELINPTAVAAADFPRNPDGMLQKTGRYAWNVNPTRQKNAIVSAR